MEGRGDEVSVWDKDFDSWDDTGLLGDSLLRWILGGRPRSDMASFDW